MEAISFTALILLSLVGYSYGVVGKAGKSVELKPQIFDLILIIFIWAAGIYIKIVFDLNKWLLLLLWIILSIIIGIIAVWPRKLSKVNPSSIEKSKEIPKNSFSKFWRSWIDLTKKMSDFHSRIILSLFFFIFVSPFALAVKMFSDPLKIKYRKGQSYWLPKKETHTDLKQSKKQF